MIDFNTEMVDFNPEMIDLQGMRPEGLQVIGLKYLRIVGYEAYLPKNLGTPHHPTIIQYPSKNLTHIVSLIKCCTVPSS